MRPLKKIKLNQLSEVEKLKKKEMNALKGGCSPYGSDCACVMMGGYGSIDVERESNQYS